MIKKNNLSTRVQTQAQHGLFSSKRSKKAEGNLVYQKIIVLILVLLVIVFVIVAIFRADVLSWMRDRLPSYGAPKDQNVTITDDQMKLLGYEKIAKVDFVKKSGDKVSHYYISFYKDYIKNRNEVISAPIFINWKSGEGNNGDVDIVTPLTLTSWFNQKVGSMTDSRIKIDISESDYNKIKQDVKNLPDFNIFIKLNDAKYIGGGIYKTK